MQPQTIRKKVSLRCAGQFINKNVILFSGAMWFLSLFLFSIYIFTFTLNFVSIILCFLKEGSKIV